MRWFASRRDSWGATRQGLAALRLWGSTRKGSPYRRASKRSRILPARFTRLEGLELRLLRRCRITLIGNMCTVQKEAVFDVFGFS